MGYSNKDLGDLGSMRARNRKGDLIFWLNKVDEQGVLNLDEAQKKAGVTTNNTLCKYAQEIIESEELQQAYELSAHGLEMAKILVQWSREASKRNAKVKNERSRILRQVNRERGFR